MFCQWNETTEVRRLNGNVQRKQLGIDAPCCSPPGGGAAGQTHRSGL